MIWKFIKADQFFPKYCPEIKNYKKKISGRSGKGKKIGFSPDEKKMIKKGLKKMITDWFS